MVGCQRVMGACFIVEFMQGPANRAIILRHDVDRLPGKEAGGYIMTLAEKLHNEGKLEGLVEGEKRGAKKGLREAIPGNALWRR
jgi:hypothetical protein